VSYFHRNRPQHADSRPFPSHIRTVSAKELLHPLSPLALHSEGWVTLNSEDRLNDVDRTLLFKLPVDMSTSWKWLARGSRIVFGTQAGKVVVIECGNLLSSVAK
jgi:hypothetical protein